MGAGGSGATMGQALDFSVQVRLAPGETAAPECVGAQVSFGEHQLPPSQVRTAVQMQGIELASIRVITLQAVDEPVVGVVVSAGCSAQLTRRFVVLADPPLSNPVAAVPAYAAATTLALPPPAAAPAAPVQAKPATSSTAVVVGPPANVSAQREPPPTRVAADAPRPPVHRVAPRRASAHAAARQLATAASARAPVARLEVDLAEPMPAPAADVVAQALDAVAVAASAARAAASAASASSARIATLEQTVARLQVEARRNDDVVVRMRQRLRRAEDAGRWTWPLLAATMLLTVLSGWLGWRLAALQQEHQADWSSVAAPRGNASESGAGKEPTAPIPFVTSDVRTPPAGAATRRRAAAWPAADSTLTQPPTVAAAPPWSAGAASQERLAALTGAQKDVAAQQPPESEPAQQRTSVLPPKANDTAPRDVSIEELIDLEQQAEFFVVLGQDEAAIDLLVEHVRNTGGGSPLPYLKLLEIYGRRGDREAYERMRSRFNHRFNAYAPEWGVDLQAGRALEDYPGVIPRLEQVWPRPLDAMAELEALLFRKSRGDLFELPAYREVLFLYSIARDLLDRETGDGGNVDLLLPLAGGEFGITAPAPYLEGEPDSGVERSWGGGRPTEPVDLDLTVEDDRQTSIFDTLDDTSPQRLPPER